MNFASLVGRRVVLHLKDGSGLTAHLIRAGIVWVRLRLEDADLYVRRSEIAWIAVEPKKETPHV